MEKEKKKKQQGLFEAYLIPMTSRLLKIPYLRAIRESVYVMMPIIMMLAIINMVGNLVLNPNGPVMSESGLGLGTFLSGGLRDQAYRDSDFYRSMMTYIEYLNITYFLYYLIFSVIFTGRLAKLWHVDRLPVILSTYFRRCWPSRNSPTCPCSAPPWPTGSITTSCPPCATCCP